MAMNSRVTLHIASRDGQSYLARNYFTPPFKIANITEDRKDPFLHLMLMCSSPGVLDGDTQHIDIRLEQDSRLWLQTQSYQRLFQMSTGATQSIEIHLEKNAGFCWLPHPCVPHANATFTGNNRIFLAEGASVLWGEVFTCGRKLNGEAFAFSSYHVRTEIYIQNRLVLLDNICLQPKHLPVQAMGQMEGFTHQASLLSIKAGARIPKEQQERIAAFLSECNDILYGVSLGPADSLVVRILGNAAEKLHDHLRTIQKIIYAS
jgi:urease accessory protein